MTMNAAGAERVALVCDYSLDYMGGAQSAFLDEARILSEHGHDVTVIAPGRPASDRGTETAPPVITDVTLIEARARWTLSGVNLPLVRNSASLRRTLRSAFLARGIDVVHIHSEFGLTAAAADAAQDLGIPVIHTVHTFFWQAHMPPVLSRAAAFVARRFAGWLRGFPSSRRPLAPVAIDSALRGMTLSTAERADAVISPSAHQARRLSDAGLAAVEVVENAAPGGADRGEPLDRANAPVRIAWIGRATHEKRVLEFVQAVLRAQNVLGPGALTVDLIGSGPLEGEVSALLEAAPAAEIQMLGRLPRDEVRERIRAAHLVALTSLGFDNQPVVVVEAFNEARSVLYVDADLAEGLSEGGILTTSPDVAGMAATLVDLARNPEVLAERSRLALRAAEVFAPERHVASLRRIYQAARKTNP